MQSEIERSQIQRWRGRCHVLFRSTTLSWSSAGGSAGGAVGDAGLCDGTGASIGGGGVKDCWIDCSEVCICSSLCASAVSRPAIRVSSTSTNSRHSSFSSSSSASASASAIFTAASASASAIFTAASASVSATFTAASACASAASACAVSISACASTASAISSSSEVIWEMPFQESQYICDLDG